jgi:hypothetical protein
MINDRFKGVFGRGRKRTPLKYMLLGTFGEKNQPDGSKTTCKVPGGSWSVWLYSNDSDAMLGKRKAFLTTWTRTCSRHWRRFVEAMTLHRPAEHGCQNCRDGRTQ